MPSPQKQRLLMLDALRGIAAIGIAIWHTNLRFGGAIWLPSAYLAVDFFFALSGFVLAHAYGRQFDGGMSAPDFLRIRLIRLYPLYFLGLALAVVVTFRSALNTPDAVASVLLPGLFMLPAVAADGLLFPLNQPAWSLFFELAVNALFAATWRWLSRSVLFAICALSLVILALADNAYGSLSMGWTWPTFGVGVARVMFSFFAGVLVFRVTDGWARLRAYAWAPCILLPALLGFPAQEGAARVAYDFLCITIGFPLIIACAARMGVPSRWRPLASFFGDASYALYAIHWPLLGLLVLTLAKFGKIPPEAVSGPEAGLVVAGLVITAWLAARLYDAPARRWLGDLGSRRLPGQAL